MGCSSCSSGGTPTGCGNKGNCGSGGCNKMNTYDWLSAVELPNMGDYDIIEVSFKNGARKGFFKKPEHIYVVTGDFVAVEGSSGGYDIGKVSLMGELVRLQMKKKRLKENAVLQNVLRAANERDMERMTESRNLEHETMVRARVLARDLKLQMKIGDVEYQGDKRKVTFYYTADGRVDFRELIRVYAREFKVKIEMRQIGARQESARIGGIGACGRELCCSTWLTDFKSVSTVAARYQNLAINQSKLSGQCGRLKCCLNYELNTYLDALKDFPRNVDYLETRKGRAKLIKTDIFKRIMYFAYFTDLGISKIHQLSVKEVHRIHAMNKAGKKPEDLVQEKEPVIAASGGVEFVDGTGMLDLKQLNKRKRPKRNRKGGNNTSHQNKTQAKTNNNNTQTKTNAKANPQKNQQKNKNVKGNANPQNRGQQNKNKQQRHQNKKQNTHGKSGGKNTHERQPKDAVNQQKNNQKRPLNKRNRNRQKGNARNKNKSNDKS